MIGGEEFRGEVEVREKGDRSRDERKINDGAGHHVRPSCEGRCLTLLRHSDSQFNS